MFRLRKQNILSTKADIARLPKGKLRIMTINAYSYNMAQRDDDFSLALSSADVLLPDGMSIVWAARMLKVVKRPTERIAGWDLFETEMLALNKRGGVCLFIGSTEKTLEKIKKRAAIDYPNVVVNTFSPPFSKGDFSNADSQRMIDYINDCNPDLLWIGMTAPKQEKWLHKMWDDLTINCHAGCIGAVFDFYAGNKKRAPIALQRVGLEWLYRLCQEPGRLWRRYAIGNPLFVINILKEYFSK